VLAYRSDLLCLHLSSLAVMAIVWGLVIGGLGGPAVALGNSAPTSVGDSSEFT